MEIAALHKLSAFLETDTKQERDAPWRNVAALVWRLEVWLVPLVVVGFLGLWEMVIRWADYPAFILPSPPRVYARFLSVLADGTLLHHTWVTATESVLGFALGFAVATILGYLLAKSPVAERLLSPYIVASQAIPIVALAPLLILWFGNGLTSKILVSALIVFFPILVNTIVGVRSVDPRWMDLMRSLTASRWQVLTKVEIPAALPVLFGGIKVGITLSVVGAVVGEFVGADQGLGFLVNLSRGLFDTPLMFVSIFTLVALALTLYTTVFFLEKTIIRWR
ncbi:MAG: ABC transporter permease [Chloroflexi bacterium]|nr:ABC transporter permease [Chloroflexota bacterium]